MNKVSKKKKKKIHGDILFLQYRLSVLVELEEYEKAAIVQRWIMELDEYFSNK